MEGVLNREEGAPLMEGNRYRLAGWLSIVTALLFPAIFVTGIVQQVVAGRALGYHGPTLGPSEGLGLVLAGISVYVLIVFRRFLNERYEFGGLNTLITLSIIWNIVFQVMGLGIDGLMMLAWPVARTAYLVISLGFLGIFMLTIGVIDILIGVRLMQARRPFSELLRVFAVISIVSGVLEVSVVLSPLALLLVPVNAVMLGIILLREKDEADFV